MRVQLLGDLLPDQVHKDRKIIAMKNFEKLRVERDREFREEASSFFSSIGTSFVFYSLQLNLLRRLQSNHMLRTSILEACMTQ
jgi:hypothetical protein